MATVIATTNKEKTIHEIDLSFCVIVHQQGIRVDVPDFVEINPHNTIDCIQKMSQGQWEFISRGQLFQTLYHIALEDSADNDTAIPIANLDDLKIADMGLQHISGLIHYNVF